MNNYGLNLGIPSFLFLESQMNPHVMHGSASLFTLSYLCLSRGIVSCIIVRGPRFQSQISPHVMYGS